MMNRNDRKANFRFFRPVGFNLLLMLAIIIGFSVSGRMFSVADENSADSTKSDMKAENKCVACHLQMKIQTAQISEWRKSKHAEMGIQCIDCHQATKGEVDAFEHNGFTISTIVSPKDCSKCHPTEVEQFNASRHAQGGNILASLDNVLGEVAEGLPAAVSGCRQCHGSKIETLPNGRLAPESWPNTGIGRINPDGSLGSCSSCHPRHRFAQAVARRPENCGRCHMGPDHPQIEIYKESKHGVIFEQAEDQLALDADEWRLGETYTAAPTCITCHSGANRELEFTHDVGTRIAWTLRPAISVKLENWEKRREDMKLTCRHCHSPGWVDNFFTQYDNVVQLYNIKFAEPSTKIMDILKKEKKITDTPFDDKIEWTYYLLWHHQGRRARHGAAMMGPDYTQWHGFFEVAEIFYQEFIPEAEKLLPGVTDFVFESPEHQWVKGLPADVRQKIDAYYKQRYGKEN